MLEALSAQYEYMDIEYVFDICGETFKLKQKKPVNLGWKALCPDDVEIPPEINYSENDTFYAEDIFITDGETKPPKRYTESSLLKAMENIDRRIEDKELSGYVSERGLGTPATRAAIIEKILADGYADRKNKVISATEMGIKMINFVPPEIKSVEMTAAMELQLAAIENGTASADEVISSITEKIKAIIEAEKHRAHTPEHLRKLRSGNARDAAAMYINSFGTIRVYSTAKRLPRTAFSVFTKTIISSHLRAKS